MNFSPTISDLSVFPVERREGQLILLRNSDHVLRRFGELELRELEAGEQFVAPATKEADKIYFVIEGQANIALRDERQGSPSVSAHMELVLRAQNPQGMLVPFGVALSIDAPKGTRLIVLSTHNDEGILASQTKL